MEYVIVTYRSRNISIKVYNLLTRKYGINCQLVSTPRDANVGCGLSVKLNSADAKFFQDRLAVIESFAGIFTVRNNDGKTIVSKW